MLKVAPSYTTDYRPQDIDLPIKRVKDHSFTILDSSGGEIYLAINHLGDSAKYTNIYISD